MQLGIDNLENAHDPIVRSERLRELREVAVRAASMIRQLLELARADAQRSPDATVKVLDVREIVRTLIADLLPVAYGRSIDLGGKRYDAALVSANAEELRIAVRNLVENALRYTPLNGCVDIDVFADDANAVIRITDTGPGVPEDALDRVFNPFFGLAAETVEGSGLGCRSRSPLLRNMVVRFSLKTGATVKAD